MSGPGTQTGTEARTVTKLFQTRNRKRNKTLPVQFHNTAASLDR